jgi:hypothetical protein
MCNPLLDPTCIPGQIIQNAAAGILDIIAGQLGAFVTALVKVVVTGWLQIPTPQVANSVDQAIAGQTVGAVAQLRAHTWWITAALAVGSLLFAAGRIAINRNGREAAELARGVFHLVVLSGLGVPIVLLLSQIGDSYSTWIINAAAGGKFEERMGKLALIGQPLGNTNLPPIALIICGLIMSVIFIVQVMLMFGRAVGLVILTGLLPAIAAGGMVGRASHSRDKALSWLLAFVLYKPVAATVYATGFWLIGEGSSLSDVFAGMMTFLIALVALPALMRLVTPAVDRLSAGAGTGAMAGLAIGASLATGAVGVGGVLASAGRGGGGGGSGGGESAAAATGAALGGTPVGLAAEAAGQVSKTANKAANMPREAASAAGETGATGSGGNQ